jgi:hypothetical protein
MAFPSVQAKEAARKRKTGPSPKKRPMPEFPASMTGPLHHGFSFYENNGLSHLLPSCFYSSRHARSGRAGNFLGHASESGSVFGKFHADHVIPGGSADSAGL